MPIGQAVILGELAHVTVGESSRDPRQPSDRGGLTLSPCEPGPLPTFRRPEAVWAVACW